MSNPRRGRLLTDNQTPASAGSLLPKYASSLLLFCSQGSMLTRFLPHVHTICRLARYVAPQCDVHLPKSEHDGVPQCV